MVKRIIALLVALAAAVGAGFGATITSNLFLQSKYGTPKPQVRLENTEKPVFPGATKLTYEIPAEDDLAAHKALAYELYAIACENYKNAEKASTFTKYRTSTVGTADGFRHTVRNGGEYFYTEYCFVLGGEDVQLLMGAFAAESTMFAERRYMGTGMSDVKAEKTIEPRPTFEIDENQRLIYTADFDMSNSRNKSYTLPAPEFDYLTDQNILVETMSSATVSYNAEEGYYILKMELDVNNPKTTQKTLPVLKDSAGDSANYTSMVEEFHIWDNGYPRYFRSLDRFTLKMIIDITAKLDYETYYHYDDISCDYRNYQHMEEFKEKLLNP